MLVSRTLSEIVGAEIWLKFENLQFTAAYKERGALNKLLQLTEEERARGVIAASAGNHAQAVAYHAKRLGIPAIIVMPESTPTIKVTQTEGHGARVVLYGRIVDDAFSKARELELEEGLTFIHAFDDIQVISGAGTLGVEIRRVFEQFEPERPCPGDDLRVVERVDEDIALRGFELARLGVGVVEHRAEEHDLRAMALGLGDFDGRGRLGHDDDRRNAEPPGVISDGLGMIAGGRSDDSARTLFVRQLKQLVERAALFVGGGELQVLELQPDLRADDFGQGLADQHRSADDGALDARGGSADVVDRRRLHHRCAG